MKTVYDIIIAPVLTEKSYAMFDEKKYTFKVDINANKFQIKEAIETIFGVEVEKVFTMRYDGKLKNKNSRVPTGKTPRYKKAIVKLTAGSKTIEFFDSMA